MKRRNTTKKKILNDSYAFNRSIEPFPTKNKEKPKPPTPELKLENTTELYKSPIELSLEEQAQQYMDAYRKAERIVITNFYTGGGFYKRGVLDAVYRGINPLNP